MKSNNNPEDETIDSTGKQDMNASTILSEDENNESGKEVSQSKSSHPWEVELGVYPLRPAAEDPKWAIRLVKSWAVIAVLSGIFVIALLILGFFFD